MDYVIVIIIIIISYYYYKLIAESIRLSFVIRNLIAEIILFYLILREC